MRRKKYLNEKEECGKCGNEEQQSRHKGPPCVWRTDPIQDIQKNHCRESWTRAGHHSWEREREREGGGGGGASATEHVRLSSVLTVVDYHSKVFYIYFLKKSHDQGWIYWIKNTVKTVILWNIIAIYYCNQDLYIKKHNHLEVIGYVLSGFDPSHQNALFERCGGHSIVF